MKKIVSLVLNVFTNDSRVLKENISLQKAGYDVTVIALGRKGLKDTEIIDGVKVKRIHRSFSKKRKNKPKSFSQKNPNLNGQKNVSVKEFCFVKIKTKLIRPVFLFFKFCFVKIKTKLIRPVFLFFNVPLFKLFFKFAREAKDADILHCNDLYTLPMGVIVKLFYNKKTKIVYDAHEYETEVNGLRGRKKIFKKILERSLIRFADKIITVSDSIANEYTRLYPIQKPYLVLNTPPLKKISKKNIFREKFSIEKDKIIVLYQGALSPGRGIEALLKAFDEIDDERSVIVFMGYGKLTHEIQSFAEKNKNIFFHPAVSPEILLDYTCSADFGICTIEDICLSYRYCLPNKMFEYLMAEIPVIVSDLPEMKKIIIQYGVGVVLKNNGSEGIKNAVKAAVKLNKNETHANILRIKKKYNWEEQEKVLLKVYEEL